VDNLCHTLVGAALSKAGLERQSRFAGAALMISANIPDLDALVLLTGASAPAFRRGWTHGVLAQALLPVALTAAIAGIARLRGSRRADRDSRRTDRLDSRGADPRHDAEADPPHQSSDPPLRVGWLLALCYVGVYSHVFLDYLNNYGVRLLNPIDWRWWYGDAVFIVDPWLWLTLGLGVWLARRQKRPRPARVAVAIAATYILAMVGSAVAARTAVANQWRAGQGSAPRDLMVGPMPVTPFTRAVIIDAGDHYRTGIFRWPDSLTLDEAPIAKNETRPEVACARSSYDIQQFLVWSRFPFWVIEETPEGTQVIVADMRFVQAARALGATFRATVVLPR
jgi:inner membrane protein